MSFRRLATRAGNGGKLGTAEEGLDGLAQCLAEHFLPYARIRTGRCVTTSAANPSSTESAPPFVASESGFPDELDDFDPLRFVCEKSQDAYLDPDSRLLPEAECGEKPKPYPIDRRELVSQAEMGQGREFGPFSSNWTRSARG